MRHDEAGYVRRRVLPQVLDGRRPARRRVRVVLVANDVVARVRSAPLIGVRRASGDEYDDRGDEAENETRDHG
jgi:hypothetical protein